MKTNVRIYFVGDKKISRKEKKHVKDGIRDYFMDAFRKMKSIHNLIRIPIYPEAKTSTKTGPAIFAETDMTREIIDILFPKKISKDTNYLVGTVPNRKNNLFYLVDVDQLVSVGPDYYIWPSNGKKTLFINLKN
jgi:hypothetical protein